jgi:DNA-binding NarL/FixJ family response regulator
MTRVAIVGGQEALRSALASALRATTAFDVVSVGASLEGASESAEVVLVVRPGRASTLVSEAAVGDMAHEDALHSAVLDDDSARDTVVDPALTNREREILALLADGLGNKQIAARLGISTNTVKTHVELLFDKLGASSRAEAVAIGVRRGALLL